MTVRGTLFENELIKDNVIELILIHVNINRNDTHLNNGFFNTLLSNLKVIYKPVK